VIGSDRAAASNELRKYAPPRGAVLGLNMIAARLTRGEISLRNSSHLPAIAASPCMNPVMFPPGRGRPVDGPFWVILQRKLPLAPTPEQLPVYPQKRTCIAGHSPLILCAISRPQNPNTCGHRYSLRPPHAAAIWSEI
jgi:hypothetical protein